jgi:uncharacterized protein (TIGR00255 family)
MIKSMTAYASQEGTGDGITVTVEIRCYNSRHLDLAIRLPSTHTNLEESVKQMISGFIQRGRVEVRIGIKIDDKDAVSFSINENVADAYYSALNSLRERFALPDPVLLDHMVRINGIIEPVEVDIDASAAGVLLEETMQRALQSMDRMRDAEGSAIAADISERLDNIEVCITRIEGQAVGMFERYYARLKDRINELTHGIVEIDQERVAQEAAIIADKSDISEEITRAKSHLNQFRKLMDADEPAGKPLNFLLQEFLREFNTMGSKSGNADISHILVSAKTEIEKIREQVQNVE